MSIQRKPLLPLAILALTTTSQSVTYTDDFTNGISPTYWTTSSTTNGLYAIFGVDGKVTMQKSGTSPGGTQNIRLSLNLAQLGVLGARDFDTAVDMSNAIVSPVTFGFNQVEFHALFQDGTFFFNVYDTSSGNPFGVHIWNGTYFGGTPIGNATGGEMKITRSGGIVRGFWNGNLIGQQSNSSPLAEIRYIIQNNGGSNSYCQAHWDNFRFTGTLPPKVISGSMNLGNTIGSGGTEAIGWTLKQGPLEYTGTITRPDFGTSNYTLEIPAEAPNGPYTLSFKGGTFLRKAFNVNLASTVTGQNLTLINGDIDQDGEVGPSDFEAVVAQFGAPGSADCDNDNEVGPGDFETIVNNFGLADQ